MVQVIKLISQVIADFANGEISQQQKVFDSSMSLDEYMDKNFYKTASLIAASCKSAAVFSGCSQEVKDSMFEYGRHLGLAFQIIDDILDFTQTAEQLGKPQVSHVLILTPCRYHCLHQHLLMSQQACHKQWLNRSLDTCDCYGCLVATGFWLSVTQSLLIRVNLAGSGLG